MCVLATGVSPVITILHMGSESRPLTVLLLVTVSGVAMGVMIQMEPIRQEWEWM